MCLCVNYSCNLRKQNTIRLLQNVPFVICGMLSISQKDIFHHSLGNSWPAHKSGRWELCRHRCCCWRTIISFTITNPFELLIAPRDGKFKLAGAYCVDWVVGNKVVALWHTCTIHVKKKYKQRTDNGNCTRPMGVEKGRECGGKLKLTGAAIGR